MKHPTNSRTLELAFLIGMFQAKLPELNRNLFGQTRVGAVA